MYSIEEKLEIIKGFPKEFQDRFGRFNSLFSKKVEGPNPFLNDELSDYEIFVCAEAVSIIKKLEEKGLTDKFKYSETVWGGYKLLEYIGLPDPAKHHSDNSWSSAVRMTYTYLAEPELVKYLHGSLAALVGDERYYDDRSDLPMI